MSLASDPAGQDAQPATPGGALFGGTHPRDLTLSIAFEVAFKSLAKPAFIGPILLFSILVNAFLEVVVIPGLRGAISYSPTGLPSIEDLDRLLVLGAITFVVSLVGGILVAVYGQVWAAAASKGPVPNVAEASALAGRRWIGVVGTSILVTLVVVAAILVGVVLLAIVGRASMAIALLLVVALIVPFFWLQARLSMATWLAADGHSIGESLRGTWRITKGNLLRIVGWTLATSLAFGLISAGLSAALQVVPYLGGGIAQGIAYALTYAAAATLYRRTQAAAMPPSPHPAAPPPVPAAPLG